MDLVAYCYTDVGHGDHLCLVVGWGDELYLF